MSTFGEELRTQRLSRGIALEQITAVTKISLRHLVALEQDRFQQLPGGILSKGIVRGYAGALGLDTRDWTDRFLRASDQTGITLNPADDGWATFASNVAKERMDRRDAMEQRLRWVGAVVLVALVAALGFLTVRYYGVRAGWWSSMVPLPSKANAVVAHVASWMKR
ncbi:MAG TPA: helix-turn-helix domain-containing protein [Terracidiphilus sp.]|jgi:cytoskeletal protein RodZ